MIPLSPRKNREIPKKKNWLSLAIFIPLLLLGALPVHAYTIYAPGQMITLGDFVYDDDFVATTSPCTITIFAPYGATIVNAVTMTANANGWHYYNFSSTTQGTWPSQMQCGAVVTGDLVKQDRTFVISTSSAPTTAEITSAVAANVNAYTDTAINTASTSLFATLPGTIWTYSSRTLSSFGTLVADIWSAGSRTLTSGVAIASDVWNSATRTLTGAGLSSGSLATNTDINSATTSVNTTIQTASTSIAAVVNANTNTQAAGVVSSVNANTNAAISTASTSLGASIAGLPASIWNVATSTMTTIGSIGRVLATNIDAAISSVSGGASLTAADVWTYATRTLTGASLNSGSLSTNSDINLATSSIISAISTASSSVVASVNTNTSANILSASTSLASTITSIPANVWAHTTRTLTSGASIASDIWAATTRTLTSLTLSSQSPWSVAMSDFGTISVGEIYRATVTTVYNGTLTDSANLPVVTVYDPDRNVIVSSASMTRSGVGTYGYTYQTNGASVAGVWETIISATVETGKTLPGNDYWNLASAPPQVIITSMGSIVVPSITANTRITNEGTVPYEYQYEWCVVSNPSNLCGGGDDVDYSSAAKLINPGENFDTVLSAIVPIPGVYYFKVAVYYGNEVSRATRQFTATAGGGGVGGGGGGGGGGSPPPPPGAVCSSLSADLNRDCRVNAIDFSILLAFWKTLPPFRNTHVDINQDTQVNAVDFSILLYQWGMVSST